MLSLLASGRAGGGGTGALGGRSPGTPRSPDTGALAAAPRAAVAADARRHPGEGPAQPTGTSSSPQVLPCAGAEDRNAAARGRPPTPGGRPPGTRPQAGARPRRRAAHPSPGVAAALRLQQEGHAAWLPAEGEQHLRHVELAGQGPEQTLQQQQRGAGCGPADRRPAPSRPRGPGARHGDRRFGAPSATEAAAPAPANPRAPRHRGRRLPRWGLWERRDRRRVAARGAKPAACSEGNFLKSWLRGNEQIVEDALTSPSVISCCLPCGQLLAKKKKLGLVAVLLGGCNFQVASVGARKWKSLRPPSRTADFAKGAVSFLLGVKPLSGLRARAQEGRALASRRLPRRPGCRLSRPQGSV